MLSQQRTLLISGASRGIGRAIARQMLEAGHRVIGIGRDFSQWETTPAAFTPWPLDLSALDPLPDALNELRREHPAIDALICNAGGGDFGALEQFSSQRIRHLIDLNLTSQILLARAFLPHFKTAGRGDLIFIGSEAARAGGRNGAVYSATKFALRGLAQALREECAGAGVRVGIVNPGMVQTGFFDHLGFCPGEAPDQHLLAEDVAAAVAAMLDARPGANIDEINLSPQKKVIRFRKDEK